MKNRKRFGNHIHSFYATLFLVFFALNLTLCAPGTELSSLGISVIPYPQEVVTGGPEFIFNGKLTIVLDTKSSDADRFAAEELAADLKKEWNIDAVVGSAKGERSLVLTHSGAPETLGEQGYRLTTGDAETVITSPGETGLFFGTQTFIQLIRKNPGGFDIPGLQITDWPDIKERAVHYDTKHHQDKASYVKSFIKDLSRYKINILVWEWEDKFAYPSHPEIGAPGAFTMDEMQEFTRYAGNYHIQLVPLVQGLGHVSFILKWPQFNELREVPASNWEFCPLKEGSYDLLFDLWDDAIKATPGSEYIHIGSDETYELGAGPECNLKAKEIGEKGLYQLFINKCAKYLQGKGRKVMAWEAPMSWTQGPSPAKDIKPVKGLVMTESYHYETPGFKYVQQATEEGYKVFAYDPNPGVVPLMVPYMFERGQDIASHKMGALEKSYRFVSSAAVSGNYDGMINTSWDDDDLHNQMWMMSFVNSAEYSWSGSQPSLQEFKESFFKNYYGPSSMNMDELFYLLNEGAYYYAWTFERNVWHWGDIGKTHMPDLPRGDALEYDPYWNREYKDKIEESRDELAKMNRALQIIGNNKKTGVSHPYDFELFRTEAELIRHTCLTYLDLSKLERAITDAHQNRFVDYQASLDALDRAQHIIGSSLERRKEVFNDLVTTWEETRLPKGMSTPEKKYFFRQDRARHFANRRPDMSFLIYDEQLLDMEGYLEKLKEYTEKLRKEWTGTKNPQ